MNNSLKAFFEYILIILTILTCNTVYMNLYNSNLNKILIVLYCITIIILILLNKIKRDHIKKYILFCLFYYMYILLFILINNIGDYWFEFVSYLLVLFPLILLYFININLDDLKRLLIKFKRIIFILSVIAFILYVLTNLNIIVNYKYVLVKWGLTESVPSFLNIYFLPQTKLRNSLFFTEPAMFSIFLVLAIAVEKIDKNSLFTKLIFMLTILTTKSATGIILGILVLILDFFKNRKGKFKLIILPLVLIGCIIIFNVFEQKTLSMSYQIRMDDYSACLQAWKEHPLFGSGFMNDRPIQSYMSYFRRSNQGLSNSFFVLLAQNGLYLILLYIIPIFNLLKKTYKTDFFNVTLMFFCLFLTTIFHNTILTFTFLSIGYAMILNKKIFSRKEI